jgi:hypothetical protein
MSRSAHISRTSLCRLVVLRHLQGPLGASGVLQSGVASYACVDHQRTTLPVLPDSNLRLPLASRVKCCLVKALGG